MNSPELAITPLMYLFTSHYSLSPFHPHNHNFFLNTGLNLQKPITVLPNLMHGTTSCSEPTPDVVRDEWKGEMEKWQPYNLEDKKFMLIQDNLTMEFDFTSRWTYHSNTSAMEVRRAGCCGWMLVLFSSPSIILMIRYPRPFLCSFVII